MPRASDIMTGGRVAIMGRLSRFSFFKKSKTAKKIMLRFGCIEPNCRTKRMLAMKRYKHFELGGERKRKGQVISSKLHLLFYEGDNNISSSLLYKI